jgi:poly-gamma-glutamate synthesis protein (capsule biosynthesis protein)
LTEKTQRSLLIGIVVGPWILFAIFYSITPRSDDVRPLEIPATGPVTIAAAGDSLIFNPIADELERDASFTAVRDAIAGANFAITSLELNLFQPADAPSREAPSLPRWPYGSAREAATLKRLGFDAVALATDHATDYGADGALSTSRILNAAALLHAGTGANLSQARAPTFAGVPQRIALISVSASSSPQSRATIARADIAGRPGLNPLRFTAHITVDAATFQTLKGSVAALNAGPPAGDRELTMFGTPIKKGDRTIVEFSVDENDEREILDEIKTARAAAEIVVVSLHSHEPSNASDAPAEFVQRFARRAIDAGAALVVGHGPHRLRGVERYKDGAILYSLGNFMYQTEGLDFRAANLYDRGADLYQAAIGALGNALPTGAEPPQEPSWWEGVIAVATLDQGRIQSLRLMPVDLGTVKPQERKGIPRAATPERAAGILTRISALSTAFGTTIQMEEGTGLVRVGTSKP